MFNIIHILAEICFCLFQGWCFQRFIGDFLNTRRNIGGTWIIIPVIYTAYKFGMDAIVSSPEPVGSILAAKWAVNYIALLILIFVFYEYRRYIFIFLSISFMIVSEISVFLSYTLSQTGGFLFNLVQHIIEANSIEEPQTIELVMNIAMLIELFVMYLVASLIMYISLRTITRYYRDKEYDMSMTELKFISAPGVVGILICLMLRVVFMTEEVASGQQIYQRYPALTVVVPLILVLSLLSAVYCIGVFQDMIAMNAEKRDRVILENQIDAQQKHIDEIERIYSGIRGMKHDMANTLTVITQHLIRKGVGIDEEMQAYISDMNEALVSYDIKYQTGNNIIDTLLSVKCHEAQKRAEGILIDAEDLIFPEDMKIRGYDLSVIIGNAIDNAIEACENTELDNDRKNVISLSSAINGNMILIKVKNRFKGRLPQKGITGFPRTTKQDDGKHGYGLLNIKRASEKYYGGVTWDVKSDTFILTILLQNIYPEDIKH